MISRNNDAYNICEGRPVPYAADNARDYLESTWSTAQTKADVDEFIKQAALDAQDPSLKAPVINTSTPPSKSLIDPLVEYIKWSIEKIVRFSPLKTSKVTFGHKDMPLERS